MAALDFPSSPTLNQIYAGNGLSWQWDGTSWKAMGATVPVSSGGTGATTAAAAQTNLDVPSRAGSGATGTWGIGISGNAATATALQTARTINGVSFNGTANISVNLNNSLSAGNGLATMTAFNGSAAQTVALGTPSTLTTSTTNSVTATSHTHAVTFPVTSVNGSTGAVAVNAFNNVLGTAPSYSVRAWVRFNGTGTVAITADGNISSITDMGTGDYILYFTTALTDGNYSIVGSIGQPATNTNLRDLNIDSTNVPVAGSVRVATRNDGAREDMPIICVVILR